MTTTTNEKIPDRATKPDGVIAVTFALPQESKEFVAKLENVRIIRRGSLPVLSGEIDGRQIAVCHTGVGEESCTTQITGFLQKVRPRCLISSGFAGGLDPALQVGNIIIAKNYSNEAIVAGISVQTATICTLTTQPEVAESVLQKTALAAKTGASAVDMETAIIFEICARRGISMVSMRGISDAAGDQLPVPFQVWFDLPTQKPRIAALLLELALHPLKIFPFTKFVRGISFTRLRLTSSLLQLIGQV